MTDTREVTYLPDWEVIPIDVGETAVQLIASERSRELNIYNPSATATVYIDTADTVSAEDSAPIPPQTERQIITEQALWAVASEAGPTRVRIIVYRVERGR